MRKRLLILTLCLGLFSFISGYSQYSTAGTDFWFGFLENYSASQQDANLYITSPVNTNCTITLANGSYTQSFAVIANTLLPVVIPGFNNPMVINDQVIQNQAIHITSVAPVTVYAANVESTRLMQYNPNDCIK